MTSCGGNTSMHIISKKERLNKIAEGINIRQCSLCAKGYNSLKFQRLDTTRLKIYRKKMCCQDTGWKGIQGRGGETRLIY